MKNKILTKLGISTCILTMAISSSSVMANTNQGNINTEVATDVKTDDVKTKIYTLEDIPQPYTIDYIAKSESVKDTTFVNKTVELTKEYKYAKAFYSNNGSADVTLIITGTNISETIPAGSGIGVLWENTSSRSKTYTVSVSGNGSENLNGIISVAKSNVKDELK